MSDAAKLVSVSRSTIRRYREAGYFPNAYQDGDRQWMIPIEDLLAKGLKPVGELSKTTTLMAPAHEPDEASSVDAPNLLNRLKDAEHQLELERANHKGTERLLHEVERRAELAERALLMIESPKPRVEEPQLHSPIAMPTKEEQEEARKHPLSSPTLAYLGNVNDPAPAVASTPKKPWWKRG